MSEPMPLDEQPRLITMQVQIPDGANGYVSLATNVPADATRWEIDLVLDKIMASAERQRALRQLPALRHERDGEAHLLDDNKVRLAEIEAGHQARRDNRHQAASRLTAQRDEVYNAAYAEHQESGKRVPFSEKSLVGSAKQRHKALVEQAVLIEAQQKKDDEEYKIARSALENEISRRTAAVEMLDRRIGECEAQIEPDRGTDLQPGAH